MKTLIVYSSQTGFTEKYAHWLAQSLGGETLSYKEAKGKDMSYFDSYDAIVYGGWAIAGKIHKAEWFMEKIQMWKDKKLALFCVGASPAEDNEEVNTFLENALREEDRKYAEVFYCQGGLDYDKMPLASKLAMKAFTAMAKRKDPKMGEMVSKSYDISDPKYLDPIVNYLEKER